MILFNLRRECVKFCVIVGLDKRCLFEQFIAVCETLTMIVGQENMK